MQAVNDVLKANGVAARQCNDVLVESKQVIYSLSYRPYILAIYTCIVLTGQFSDVLISSMWLYEILDIRVVNKVMRYQGTAA